MPTNKNVWSLPPPPVWHTHGIPRVSASMWISLNSLRWSLHSNDWPHTVNDWCSLCKYNTSIVWNDSWHHYRDLLHLSVWCLTSHIHCQTPSGMFCNRGCVCVCQHTCVTLLHGLWLWPSSALLCVLRSQAGPSFSIHFLSLFPVSQMKLPFHLPPLSFLSLTPMSGGSGKLGAGGNHVTQQVQTHGVTTHGM